MRLTLWIWLTAWLTLCASQAQAQLPSDVDGQPLPSLAPIIEQRAPAVVNINTARRVQVRDPMMADPLFRFFYDRAPRERISRSLGSGVIIDAERGLVLTNNHVIEDADAIAVTLADGRQLEADVIGTDPDSDLALINIAADGLTALPLANSDALRVGDFVLAVGNPFGLGQSVSSGIVSALGRTGLSGVSYQNFIQTDASINPGNSGGALLNLRGELVGINTAIFSPSGGNVGIGFAIPAKVARQVTEQLLEYGVVQRGQISVSLQNVSASLAQALGLKQRAGVVITDVMEDSDAHAAGLRAGDIVLSIDGQAIRQADEVRNRVGLAAPGEPLALELLRDGEPMALQAPLSQPPLQQLSGEHLDPRLRGASFAMDIQTSKRRGAVSVIVLEQVAPGSPAWQRGLRPGDRLLAVNQQGIDKLDQLRQLLGRQPSQFFLQILRGQQSLLVAIR
jgi:Do/DeqQ family serine protease